MYIEPQKKSLADINYLYSDSFHYWVKEATDQKILVVDDDPEFRSLMTEHLELQGFKVMEAQSGKEALTLINEDLDNLPRLILLDYLMPKETGMSFLQKLSDQTEIAEIPTVMVTGYNLNHIEENKVKGLLMKPFDWSELDELVGRILQEA